MEAEVLALETGMTARDLVARLGRPKTTGVLLGAACKAALTDHASRFAPLTKERLTYIAREVQELLPGIMLADFKASDLHRYREIIAARPGRIEERIGKNTLRWHLKQVRLLYRLACSTHGLVPADVFKGALPEEEPTEARYLEDEEIAKAQDFSGDRRIELARDAVLLQFALGGMRFGDAYRLKPEAVAKDSFQPRQGKTKTIVLLPIIPLARSIIVKYQGGPLVLPMGEGEGHKAIGSANAWVNDALKKLAYACGINPKLSTHYARGTWANWALANGVDINTIRVVLGHKSLRTTIVYLSKFPNRAVSEAFIKLQEQFGV